MGKCYSICEVKEHSFMVIHCRDFVARTILKEKAKLVRDHIGTRSIDVILSRGANLLIGISETHEQEITT